MTFVPAGYEEATVKNNLAVAKELTTQIRKSDFLLAVSGETMASEYKKDFPNVDPEILGWIVLSIGVSLSKAGVSLRREPGEFARVVEVLGLDGGAKAITNVGMAYLVAGVVILEDAGYEFPAFSEVEKNADIPAKD